MTDENMIQETAQQPMQQQQEMISPEALRGRLEQARRQHEKELAAVRNEMQSKMDAIQQQLGNQAAQNVVNSQPSQSMQPQQPQFDVNKIKQDLLDSINQTQAEQKQQELNNKRLQIQNGVINEIKSSQEQDPEFQQLMDQHQANMPSSIVGDLVGEAKPAGVLKMILNSDELRNDYQNAQTPEERNIIVRKASNAFNAQMAANNMSKRPGGRIPTARAGSSRSAISTSDVSDLRQHYKDLGLR